MRFRVVITPEAEQDLRIAYRYIRGQAPAAARTWLKGARQAIKSLSRNPERASVAAENSAFDETILQLFYGKGNRGTYRILFTILDRKVFVLHVRHGSMLPLQPKK